MTPLEIAAGCIGLKEADGSYLKILDGYNQIKPLPRGHKMQQGEAWCACFASYVFHTAGVAGFPSECSCGEMVKKLQAAFLWVENDAYKPEPGDLIFYHWADKGTPKDCTGAPNHVGVVERVSGGSVHVIEGNYTHAVKRRVLKLDGLYIRGYGRTSVLSPQRIHTVARGDSLWALAQYYLGDGTKYRKIMEANNLRSILIYPGQKLVIP